MSDPVKFQPLKTLAGELACAVAPRRRGTLFLYGFAAVFVVFTAYLAFSAPLSRAANVDNSSSSPRWSAGLFAPYSTKISGFLSSLFPAETASAASAVLAKNETKVIPENGRGGFLGAGGGAGVESTENKTAVASDDGKAASSGSRNASLSNGKGAEGENGGSVAAPAKNVSDVLPSNAQDSLLGRKGGGGSPKSESVVLKNAQSSDGNGLGATGGGVPSSNVSSAAISVNSKANAKNVTGSEEEGVGSKIDSGAASNTSQILNAPPSEVANTASTVTNQTRIVAPVAKSNAKSSNESKGIEMRKEGTPAENGTANTAPVVNQTQNVAELKEGNAGSNNGTSKGNAETKTQKEASPGPEKGELPEKNQSSQTNSSKDGTAGETPGQSIPPEPTNVSAAKNADEWIKAMIGCDMFKGKWVKDDSYPLYPEGSCPHIDEPFDCYLNGRPDREYQKLRWQPHGCMIPRFNATDFLERIRGKRLAFVGDSLNRNMWESMVCALRHSIKDKQSVFEASGRKEFRTEGSYLFVFKDYNCTVEFFRSPFLVQELENTLSNGTKKETLRLDVIENSSGKYENADIIVFNTGHWWTHEKTSLGKDYYQEGDHVYSELNVTEAFRKALSTWAQWVDSHINSGKTFLLFRGYSASHFSGGQWNSGGACDNETEPIKNEQYLNSYPEKMQVLEEVIGAMKTPVVYLNITRMTDYRKDAHPSIYRKQNLTEEERRSPERYQDCSHWCLPGVPDSWNEILYAQLVIKQYQTGVHR